LREKYLPEADDHAEDDATQIRFGSKVAQEMGFDKTRRQFAQVKVLKRMILEGMRIQHARSPDEDTISETCPNLTQVDLSRNMFTELGPVMDICEELPALRILRLKLVVPDGAHLSAQVTNGSIASIAFRMTFLKKAYRDGNKSSQASLS
jgi:hypothetical protein